jgi:homoserine kinase type II
MDIPLVLQSWDIGAMQSVEEVLSGSVNRVFRASTDRGVFYLRVYRNADRDTVAREHALIGHVAASGLPAVSPIATTTGTTIVQIDACPAALFCEASGQQCPRAALNLEHAAAAGEMLGRLHLCMAGLAETGIGSSGCAGRVAHGSSGSR